MFEFRILGPVELWCDDVRAPVQAVKVKTLLVALLLNPGRVLSFERLVDALWEATPPASALANLRTYATTLRQALRAPHEADASRLVTHGHGYLLRVEPGELDLQVFEQRAGSGRAALSAGRPDQAVEHLRSALELWRDTPACGLQRTSLLRAWLAPLEERRLSVLEDHTEARLTLGEDAELTAGLLRLVAEQPLRERAWWLLMSAFYRAGDVAAALDTYRQARASLVEALGVEPGPALQQLQQSMLARGREPQISTRPGAPGPAIHDVSRPRRPGSVPAAIRQRDVGPHELPPATILFGREAECAMLISDLLSTARGLQVITVNGPAGVGKSALAVHVAHSVSPGFPDGQVYVDLSSRGRLQAPSPRSVLHHVLQALEVRCPRAAPVDVLSARLRSVLADCRVLLVVDNAEAVSQVLPLLPATAGCAVLVTSRRRLPTLDAERTLALEPLSVPAAKRMLERFVDVERLRAEPIEAAGTLTLCGRMPLALRTVAARLATRPHLRLSELVKRLDGVRPLDEMVVDDLSVRERLQEDVERLTAGVVRAFIALGALRTADTTPVVVAGLLDIDVAEATAALDQLVEARLMEARLDGRYTLTRLPYLLAVELAHEHTRDVDLGGPIRNQRYADDVRGLYEPVIASP